MSQHEPPQQTPPQQPPRPPGLLARARGRSGRSRAAWIGGGLALLLAVLGITAAVAGPAGRHSQGGSTSTPGSSGTVSGTSAPAGGGNASGRAGTHNDSRSTAPAATVPLTHPSTRLAPSPARAGAAAILLADDSHYRQELTTGLHLLGSPGFAAWSARTLADTADRSDTARAEAGFTASDQPPALIPWRADNGAGVGAVGQFARDGAGGASIATRTDAANALASLADADQLAGQVRAGD